MAFVKNTWYVAAWSSEVTNEEPFGCVVADVPVVIYRDTERKLVALEDRCSHRCAPLSKGRIEGGAIRCWYHGLLFGDDGRCIEMPGQDLVEKEFDIHCYPVFEKEGWVWVWLGDASLADQDQAPATLLDENGLNYRTGRLRYESNYQLINDNLCDLSHVAYVHENTLARDATDWVQRPATHTVIDNGVRVTRWIVGSQPLPMPGLPERVDIWTDYNFYAPGIMTFLVSYYPTGTAESLNLEPPKEGPIFALRNIHAATPVNEKTTDYRFGVSLPVNPQGDALLDPAIAMVTAAFEEDKETIENQQKALDRYPDVKLKNTIHDKALVRIRRLISGKIREEQKQ